jgi:hypothetical protein
LLAESPQRALSFELRVKPDEVVMKLAAGNTVGLEPAAVLRELDDLLAIGADDIISVEVSTGDSLLRGTGLERPSVFAAYYRPLAANLVTLQHNTTERLLMPDFLEMRPSEFRAVSDYAAIYAGDARVWTWTGLTQTAPADPHALEDFKNLLRRLKTEAGRIVVMELPTIMMAAISYTIQRPLVSTYHSQSLPPDLNIENIQAGDLVELKPGYDDRVTTAALAEWTPGDEKSLFASDPA